MLEKQGTIQALAANEPKHASELAPNLRRWDIFCQVIDNYGDIGVCWRLASQLQACGAKVRFFVDDASALAWMAPERHGIEAFDFQLAAQTAKADGLPHVVIEGFGCRLPEDYIELMQQAQQHNANIANAAQIENTKPTQNAPVWINLEYLSAEDYVERSHALASPQQSGLVKWFFYPGFTKATGGLLREPDLAERQAAFDINAKKAFLKRFGLDWHGERLVSLFCYEPALLAQMLDFFDDGNTLVLATHGRSTRAIQNLAMQNSAIAALVDRIVAPLPALSQEDFDHLLWACDVNFVRGEDSLVRALWAGKPMVWQIYPQDDLAHHAKLEAFLNRMQADSASVAWHRSWNGLNNELINHLPTSLPSRIGTEDLRTQMDLCSQIIAFSAGKMA